MMVWCIAVIVLPTLGYVLGYGWSVWKSKPEDLNWRE